MTARNRRKMYSSLREIISMSFCKVNTDKQLKNMTQSTCVKYFPHANKNEMLVQSFCEFAISFQKFSIASRDIEDIISDM